MENQDEEQSISQNYKARIKQLTEINKKLESELQDLKNEYAQSLNVIPNLQKVYGEVNALKKSLCEYQSKNDDLQRRLDIAIEANNEIAESTRSKEQTFNIKDYEKEITDLNIDINKLKSENKIMKSQYQNQLHNYESSLYESQCEASQLQSNISKLLKAADSYFSNHFETIKDLINFLNGPSQKNEVIDSKLTSKDVEIQALSEKINHLKSKYRNEKQKVKTLQIGILKIKKKIESQELQTNQQITLLQDKNNQQENEIKRLLLINEQKKVEEQANYRHRNQMVQVSLTEDEAKLNETFRHDLESATSLINENETTISNLRKDLEEAQNQLLKNEMEKSQLSTKLQYANIDIEDLTNQIMKQKKINEQLSLVGRKQSLQEKVSSKGIEGQSLNEKLEKDQIAKDQIEKEQLEKELADANDKCENLLQTNNHLEDLLQGQKAEIEDLCNVKDKLITVIEQQSILYNELEKSIEQQQNNQHPKVIEREITVEPKFDWQFGNLPHEISDIVTQIAENDSLSIESRIKSIFTVINKYIENEQNSHQKEKDSIEQSNQDIQNEYNEYKNSIAEAFNQIEGESNGKSIDSEEAPKLISDTLIKSKQMQNELETLNKQNQKLFSLAGSQSFDGAYEKLKTLNDDLKRKSSQLKEEKKKRSVLRKQMSQVLSTKDKELEQKTSTLKKINENSRNQVNQLQNQLDQLTEQNKSLLHQLSSLSKKKHRSKKKQINIENNENNDQNNNQNNANSESNQTEYSQFECSQLDNTHLRYQVDDLSDQVSILNKEIAQLKQLAKDYQNEAFQQKAKNEEIKKNCEEEISRAQSACRSEKAQMQNTIDDLNGKLLIEAKNHREAINDLNDTLSNKEKQLDKLNQKIMDLKFELDKAQMNAESKVEASERSRKLSECQYKAKILSIESQHTIDLEEQKKNDEKAKRDLIQFFIKNFSTFSNMHDQLDEDSFKETVRKVKTQFDKCQKREIAIRKLIKAKDKESTDDALTQFIIRMHPQFQSQQ